ncbi:MAG TPA: hypothetical protein GXX18_08930 [Bacillales bacterium]|nr:hypothetical protein [Bacillales bacterium]
MCELLTVKSEESIPIEWIFHYASLLDKYGIAGFGWGVAWKCDNGQIRRYRAIEGVRNDVLAPQTLKGLEAKEYLVHLRRPSLMKSMAFNNSQPYLNEEESLAFAHNGYFTNHDQFRPLFINELQGTSDSEIGYQYYLTKTKEQKDPVISLELTHQKLEGKANLVVFQKDQDTLLYAGNDDNRMYVFDLDDVRCASTSLHSQDDFLFQAIFPTATNVKQIPLFSGCELTTGRLKHKSCK